MRQKIPVDAQGQFPANAELGAVAALGVLFFNELLLWGVAAKAGRIARSDLGPKMLVASAAVGIAIWALVVGIQRWQRVCRRRDVLVAGLALAVIASAFRDSPLRAGQIALANAVMLIWAFRSGSRSDRTDTRPPAGHKG
jgi:hypothetical protein